MRRRAKGPGVWDLWKTLPRAFPYARPYRRLNAGAYGLTLTSAIVALAAPWPLAIVVDQVLGDREPTGILKTLTGGDPSPYFLLGFAVFAGFLLTFITHGVDVLTDWVTAKLEQRMVLDLRTDMFNHAQGLSLTFHDGRMTGQLMQQINNQAAAMGAIMVSFPPIVQAALTLVGMFIITTLIAWQVAAVALVAVPFIWWSLGLYSKKIVPRLQRVQALEWQSLSIVHEAMAMLRVIVAFGREKHESRRFRSQGEIAVDERVKLTVRQTLFSLAVTSATAIGTGLVLGTGALLALDGQITVGQLLVLIAYVAAMYQPLEQISNTIGTMNDQFVQFNSSLDLLDEEKEVKEAPDAIDIGRSSGSVTFEHVDFAYKGRKATLRDISFRAEPGQRVAIVGPTGAGKSTLISLLVRYYDPHAGRVLIDGVDLRKLTLECLREQISVVLQEPLLFSGSIADNIAYGKLDAGRDEIEQAARSANVHDFISSLPDGYETVLGERGAQLSGGERQRIAVARAFIKDAPILVLDEPTSSIDSKTEDVILDALEDLMVGRTSFMIAHRLSTVRDADLILVIEDGRIAEQGSHDELIEFDGVYAQLHGAQTRTSSRRARRVAVAVAEHRPTWEVVDAGPPVEEAEAAGDFDGPAPQPTPPEPDDFDARPNARRDRHEPPADDGDDAPLPRRAVPELSDYEPAPRPERRRRRPAALLVLASVIGAFVLGGVLLGGGDEEQQPATEPTTRAPREAVVDPERPAQPIEPPSMGAAGNAAMRDDYATAAATAELLPPDEAERVRRRIGVRLAERATAALDAGDVDEARRLLDQTRLLPSSERLEKAREWLRAAG